jgi:hypothetical protein
MKLEVNYCKETLVLADENYTDRMDQSTDERILATQHGLQLGNQWINVISQYIHDLCSVDKNEENYRRH